MKIYRSIVYFLFGAWIFAFRDLKTRYAGSFLGAIWIILYPLLMAAITSIVFALAFKKTVENVPFFLYTLAGFSAWVFFVQTINSSTRSLVQNRDIIVNNNIPTELILGGVVLSRCVDLCITTVFLIISSTALGVLSFNPLFFLKSMLILLLITCTLSFITAASNVYFRDVQALVDIILNIIFYATPIIYPLSAIPVRYLWVFNLNPLTSIFSGFRASILPFSFNFSSLNLILVISFLSLLIVFTVYKRLEKNFAQFL